MFLSFSYSPKRSDLDEIWLHVNDRYYVMIAILMNQFDTNRKGE